MNHFLELEDNGIRYSFENALENKKKLLPKLEEAKKYYEGSFTKAEAKSYAKTLADLVPASIDQLESSLPRERSLSQRERLWTGRLYRSQFMTLMS